MDRKIDFFTIREVLESGLRGFCKTFSSKYRYQTIFYNSTESMENAKMFVGVWFNGKFYELKITRKRDRIEPNTQFNTNGDKGILYEKFYNFITNIYPIIRLTKSYNKLYVIENLHDYEVSFILKRGVT